MTFSFFTSRRYSLKRRGILLVTSALVILAGAKLFLSRNGELQKSLSAILSDLGPPTYLAKTVEIVDRRGRTLRVHVTKTDPESVSDWAAVTNIIGVWTTSSASKKSARYFYSALATNTLEHGWDVSSEGRFGEVFRVLDIDSRGNVSKARKLRAAALSLRVYGVPFRPVPTFRAPSNAPSSDPH
jgi:hypothetical protein